MNNTSRETKSAGGVVVNKAGQILVVSQNGDSWSLPKGQIEEGEDDLTAANREVYEESGINQLELICELGSYKRYRIGKNGLGEDQSETKIISMFLFKTKEDSLKPIDPENPEACWVEKNKVAELLTHPKDREFFLSVLEKI